MTATGRSGLSRDAALIWTLARSGVFDVAAYQRANPDVSRSRWRALVHFCRHGRHEQRQLRQPAFTQWLLAKMLCGKLGACEAHKLRRVKADPVALAVAADRLGLNVDVLRFLELNDAQDYPAALRVLDRLPVADAFAYIYLFARRHMRTDRIAEAAQWGLQEIARAPDQPLDFYIALRDMAEASGYAGSSEPQANRAIIEAFACSRHARWPSPGRALWQVGYPVLGDNSDAFRALVAALPPQLSAALQAAPSVIPPDADGWTAWLNLATLNALTGQTLTMAPDGRVIDAGLPEPADHRIDARMLVEGYWRQAETDVLQASFLTAFKAAFRRAEKAFTAICPRPGGQIFNIDRACRPSGRSLSYHTVSRREAGAVHFKEAALPGYFLVSRTGFSGWSEPVEPRQTASDEAVSETFRRLHAAYVETRVTKYAQATDEATNLPEAFVLVALQVPDDTVASLAFMTREAMIDAVCRSAGKLGFVPLIKAHPLDRSAATDALLSRVQENWPSARVSNAPIHDLLAQCKAVVTVNSGVGFEALLHLKPVITAGASDYSAASLQAETPAQVETAMHQALSGDGVPDMHVKRFLHAYLQVCFRSDGDMDALDRALSSLEQAH